MTTASGERWTFPKGIIEDDLGAVDSAAKEAFEEAGIIGEVSAELIGEYAYIKSGGTCHVLVYPMLVREILDHWDEEHLRTRIWVPVAEAASVVSDAGQQRILRAFASTFTT